MGLMIQGDNDDRAVINVKFQDEGSLAVQIKSEANGLTLTLSLALCRCHLIVTPTL